MHKDHLYISESLDFWAVSIVNWLRFAHSKGPKRVDVSFPSPEYGSRSSFRTFVFLLVILISERFGEPRNPAKLSTAHHRQNHLYSLSLLFNSSSFLISFSPTLLYCDEKGSFGTSSGYKRWETETSTACLKQCLRQEASHSVSGLAECLTDMKKISSHNGYYNMQINTYRLLNCVVQSCDQMLSRWRTACFLCPTRLKLCALLYRASVINAF
jgi:hypothetical protein